MMTYMEFTESHEKQDEIFNELLSITFACLFLSSCAVSLLGVLFTFTKGVLRGNDLTQSYRSSIQCKFSLFLSSYGSITKSFEFSTANLLLF